MARVVFLHAHPDDEAIFTGGTMARLIEAGHRVDLVMATGGQLGIATAGDHQPLAARRQAETHESCRALGLAASNVTFLPFEDSGMHGENTAGLAHRDPDEAATRLFERLGGPIDALVTYDDHGIYGHPDHVAVHQIAHAAAEHHQRRFHASPSLYESTVDREYLHFVETHVVVDAGGGRPEGRGLASTKLGLPSLEIDTTIDVSSALERKRAAMAAHASQLPADAPLFELGQANFAAVYGFEWYRRVGPRSALDELGGAEN